MTIEKPWNAYRSHMTSANANPRFLDVVRRLAREWLATKKIDASPDEDADWASDANSLVIRNISSRRFRALRIELRETIAEGDQWSTQLLAAHPATGDPWIDLSVSNSEGRYAAPPRLVRTLASELALRDASMEIAGDARQVSLADVESVIEAVLAPDRFGLAMVAGTAHGDEIPFDPFLNAARVWGNQSTGLGQLFVATPDATKAISDRLGEAHALRPWAIRTFYPNVDLSNPADGLRHRTLGTERLAGMKDRAVSGLLGRISRMHASSRGELDAVVQVRREFERIANSMYSREHLLEGSAVALEEGAPALIESLQSLLGPGTEFTPAVVAQVRDLVSRGLQAPKMLESAHSRIVDLQVQVETAEDHAREQISIAEEYQLEVAQEREDNSSLRASVRFLQKQLVAAGEAVAAYSPLPEEDVIVFPESLSEALEWLARDSESGVKFTGQVRKLEEIESVDTLGQAARTLWGCYLTLKDYLRARQEGVFDLGVDAYIKNTPPGYLSIDPGKHAARESNQTMAKYGNQRIFSVPSSVSASEHSEMQAHFRLAKLGSISPRMYYLDDYANSGLIVIGYIGRHLDNTKTSSM